jgi:outer membrane lipoprotein carrier protein
VFGVWGLGMLAVTAFPAAQTAPVDPAVLARSIQRHYDTVRDFSATFVHAYEGGVLRKTVVERGTVRFKKPGLMRWVYTHPERKEFVSDGVRLYAYVPEDRQVTVSAVPAGDGATTPALFLAGQGNLTRDFVASAPVDLPPQAPATLAVTLTPRKAESEFEWMTLIVDGATMQIRGLVTADAQGGRSSFTFDRVRENTGVGDQEFRFTIPRGVDVITNRQTGR